MMHPTNNHWPTLKGMAKQPSIWGQSLKTWLCQLVVVNMVIAEKMSET